MALKLAGEAMDSRNKVRSEASKFFFVTRFFFVTEFFVVTKFFFVTGTIVPIPIPCTGLLWKPALIFICSEVRKGGVRTQMQNGVWCCVQLLVTGSECVQ